MSSKINSAILFSGPAFICFGFLLLAWTSLGCLVFVLSGTLLTVIGFFLLFFSRPGKRKPLLIFLWLVTTFAVFFSKDGLKKTSFDMFISQNSGLFEKANMILDAKGESVEYDVRNKQHTKANFTAEEIAILDQISKKVGGGLIRKEKTSVFYLKGGTFGREYGIWHFSKYQPKREFGTHIKGNWYYY